MAAMTRAERFDSMLSNSEFAFVIFYRGHWCPFCMAYLTKLHEIEKSIAVAGGTVLVVTAEPEEQIAATRKATGLEAFIAADTKNELAAYLKEQGMVDVAISEKKGYAEGMAQPAVLVVRGEKGAEGAKKREVLESWAIVPSTMNFGGAKDRPDLNQIWDNVQAKLKGADPVHAKYSLLGPFGLLRKKVFG